LAQIKGVLPLFYFLWSGQVMKCWQQQFITVDGDGHEQEVDIKKLNQNKSRA